jgi:hypothetical protein
MNAAIIALITAFAVPPSDATLPPLTDIEVRTPSPTILEAVADEELQSDGRRVRWVSVTYELSSGRQAEAFVEVDDHGRADALIYSEGEPLVHVTTDGRGNTSRWLAPNSNLSPEDFSQLLSGEVAEEVFTGIGNEHLAGPCSESTKKWVRLTKYAWLGALGGAVAVCCGGTVGAACAACGVFGGIAAGAAEDIANDYCS